MHIVQRAAAGLGGVAIAQPDRGWRRPALPSGASKPLYQHDERGLRAAALDHLGDRKVSVLTATPAGQQQVPIRQFDDRQGKQGVALLSIVRSIRHYAREAGERDKNKGASRCLPAKAIGLPSR